MRNNTARIHAAPLRATPRDTEALHQHNERIGAWSQRWFQRTLFIVIFGPLIRAALGILFRFEIRGAERLEAFHREGGIWVARHFYEWDPILNYYAAAWGPSLRHPHLVAQSIAGRFWTKSAVRRLISWCLGIMGFVPGGEPAGAISRASRLLRSGARVTVAIYPTGPVGRDRTYEIKPGFAYLALSAPDAVMLPLTTLGLQELRWTDVILLRRPKLTVSFGAPFRAREIEGRTEAERADRIVHRIQSEWVTLETQARRSRLTLLESEARP